MRLRSLVLSFLLPASFCATLKAQPCDSGSWATLSPGGGIECFSQTGTASFGGYQEFEDSGSTVASSVYATVTVSGTKIGTFNTAWVNIYDYNTYSSFSGTSFYDYSLAPPDFVNNMVEAELKEYCNGTAENSTYGASISGVTVSPILKVQYSENEMFLACEDSDISYAGGAGETQTIRYSLSGSPFSAALAAASASAGSSPTTSVGNISVSNPSSSYEVTGTFTGTTVDFTARLSLASCGGDYEVVENYTSSVSGAFPKKRTLSNARGDRDGVYYYSGSVPLGDVGETITLESISYRQIFTCDDLKSDLGSVDWRYPLNFYKDGGAHSTGLLSMQVDSLSDAYDPAKLQFAAASDDVPVVLTNADQNIEQILTAYHLVNVAAVDLNSDLVDDGFTLTIYAREDVNLNTDLSTNEIFNLKSGAVFTEQYQFADPDFGSPSGTLRTLIVSRFTNGSTTASSTATYTHDSTSDEWTLAISGEDEVLSLEETVVAPLRTETRIWRDLLGNTIRIKETVYETFTDGGAEIELPVEERNWADYGGSGTPIAATLKSTTWNYYESGSHFGLLQNVEYPDGRWMRYTYDNEDRVATEVSGYLGNDSTTADSANRLTRYERFDAITLGSETGDLKIETLLIENQIVGQTMEFRVEEVDAETGYLLEKTISRRYLTAVAETTAGWSSGTYEESTDWEFTSGPWENKPRRVIGPDGIETYYAYTELFNFDAQQFAVRTESWSGVYDSVNSEFTEGTYGKEESDLSNNLIYRETTDIESNLLIDTVIYSNFDSEGRGLDAVFLDGTTETRQYGCCGLESFTDRSGVTTTYEYDDLGNRTGQTRDDIRTYEEDSFDTTTGFQLNVTKQDGRDATTRTIEQSYTDGLGRLRKQLNGADHETTWTYSTDADGGETVEALYANGGTRKTVYYRDGRLRAVEGTAQTAMRYAYGTESLTHDGNTFYATWEQQILMEPDSGGTSYSDTAEVTKRFYDPLGRMIKAERPSASGTGLATTQYFYDAEGLLERTVDPHGIATLYSYDDLKRPDRTALDVNDNGSIDLTGPDRVAEIYQGYVATGNEVITGSAFQQIGRVYTDSGAEDVSLSLRALEDEASYSSTYGRYTSTQVELDQPVAGQRTLTTIQNGLTTLTEVYQGDRLISSVVTDATGQVIRDLDLDYDAYNRLGEATDARNGLTAYTYYNDDRIHTATTPDPDTSATGIGLDAQTTTWAYNFPAGGGEEITTTYEDGSTRQTHRDVQGRTIMEYGQGTYPQELTYDYAGRLKTLTTWADFSAALGVGVSGDAVTEWNYSDAGVLEEKVYPDSSKLAYTYTIGGLLKTRTNARSIVTTYGYAFEQGSGTSASDLLSIDYSDNTPDVTYSNYDRQGRPQTITDASGQRALTYFEGQLVETAYQSGALTGLSLVTPIDVLGRPETLELTQDDAVLHNLRYYYTDNSGMGSDRLQAIGWRDTQIRYSYLDNSNLVAGHTLSRQGNAKYTQSKTYDSLDRLTEIQTQNDILSTSRSYAYQYNDLNQRTRRTVDSSNTTDWTYDALGQLDTATNRFADNSLKPGGSFDYDFDHIGNRTQTAHNGTAITYDSDPDGLNQYTQRDTPRSHPVYGEVNPNVAIDVTVNSAAVTTEQGQFYTQADFSPSGFTYPADTDVARYENISIEARKSGGTADEVARFSADIYLPPHPEAFAHDADGNLDYDGQWDYSWDAENRLIAMETRAIAYIAGAPRQKLEFAYDSQGRRFNKKVYDWDGSDYQLTEELVFIYDGWNLIAELNNQTSPFTVHTSYLWGLDLSGSLQGAGGVGGLLAVSDESGSTAYPTYDGNGNVMGYYAADTGESSAEFEYGPFGEQLRATGIKKDDFRFRSSTKYQDAATGLLYYGFRYYGPEIGRWLSRDPIGELGGLNLYGMIGNNPISFVDYLGLNAVPTPVVPNNIIPFPNPGVPNNVVPFPASSTSASAGASVSAVGGATVIVVSGVSASAVSMDIMAKELQMMETRHEQTGSPAPLIVQEFVPSSRGTPPRPVVVTPLGTRPSPQTDEAKEDDCGEEICKRFARGQFSRQVGSPWFGRYMCPSDGKIFTGPARSSKEDDVP